MENLNDNHLNLGQWWPDKNAGKDHVGRDSHTVCSLNIKQLREAKSCAMRTSGGLRGTVGAGWPPQRRSQRVTSLGTWASLLEELETIAWVLYPSRSDHDLVMGKDDNLAVCKVMLGLGKWQVV